MKLPVHIWDLVAPLALILCTGMSEANLFVTYQKFKIGSLFSIALQLKKLRLKKYKISTLNVIYCSLTCLQAVPFDHNLIYQKNCLAFLLLYFRVGGCVLNEKARKAKIAKF